MSVLPWITLAAVIWLQSIGGTNTDFPAYSSHLKSRLRISQIKLNNLAVASDAGKLFGWVAGAAAARLPLWSVLAIGAVLGAGGYGVQFLFVCRKIPSLSYVEFWLLNMVNGNSVCWLNTVGYIAVMRRFSPKDHGTVFALTTSYTGLTAKIYMALADVITGNPDSVNRNSIYLLLNAVTPAVVGLLAMPTLGSTKPKPADVKWGLGVMFGIAVVTGGYAVAETAIPKLRDSLGGMAATVLLVMVAAVIGVPVWKAGEWVIRWRREKEMVADEVEIDGVGDVEEGKEEREEEDGEMSGEENVKGVWELIKRVNFWVYFMVYLCGATLGLVYGNNIGQISESRGVSETILLSVSSSFGFFGRLATAPLSIYSRISKTGTISILMVAMAASFFLLLFPCNAALLVGTAIIGLCSGAISSIAVSVSAELFGEENFGMNHNIVIANIPIGSFLFGTVAAVIYDGGERAGTGGGVHGVCVGTECYRNTFIIWGCICSLGTVLSFVLFSRTTKRAVSRR